MSHPKYYILITRDGIRSELKPLGAELKKKFITACREKAKQFTETELDEPRTYPQIREYRLGKMYLVAEYEEV